MFLTNFVDHQGSDGNFAQDRMRENCYYPEADQEIVWGGNTDNAGTIVSSWLADENWRRAMLDPYMEDFGVGYRSGGESNTFSHYFAVNFGRPESTGRAVSPTPACVLTLENEYGSGSWRIYDAELCQKLDLE